MAGLFNPAQLRTMGNPQTMDDNLAQYALAQRLRESQAMRDEADAPIDNGMAGGQVVPIQWTQMLSKVLKGYGANKLEADALQQSQDYATAKRQRMAAALQGLDLSSPDAMLKAAPGLLGNSDTQGIGNELLVSALRQRAVDAAAARQDAQFNQRMSQSDKQFEQRQQAEQAHWAQQLELEKQRLAQGANGGGSQYYQPVPIVLPDGKPALGSFNARTGKMEIVQLPGQAGPVVKSSDSAPLQAEITGEKAKSGALGKEEAANIIAEPGRERDRATILGNIDEFSKMPGFESLWGPLAGRTPDIMPNTANAEAKRAQLVEQLSFSNIDKLRGQGQITDSERIMLRNLSTMLADRRISAKQAMDELSKAKVQLMNPIARIGVNNDAAAKGPQPGTVEDGHRFKGGDPSDPKNWEPVSE